MIHRKKQLISLKILLLSTLFEILINSLVIPVTIPMIPMTHATTLQRLTLGQLTRLSHLVARGTVIDRQVIEDTQGGIWTTYHIKLTEVWQGAYQSQDIIELTLRGGVLGAGVTLRGQEISGQPQLQPNQNGVFFLERTAQGQLVFTGMTQGWFLSSQQNGVEWLTRDTTTSAHFLNVPQAQALMGSVVDLDSLSLTTLRRLVRQGASKAPQFNPHQRGDSATLQVIRPSTPSLSHP